MLVFVSLIVARWLGWSAPNLGEAEVLKLWDIVEIGLGGYVIGRSAEKVLPELIRSIRKDWLTIFHFFLSARGSKEWDLPILLIPWFRWFLIWLAVSVLEVFH